jgi:hypothetical protein
MSNDDYKIDDLIDDLNKKMSKKKPKNSSRKGKRGERDLCKILIERFKKPFSRVVGSGARTSQVNLSEEAKLVLTGDITSFKGFFFSIEVKHGYSEIDLCNALDGGNKLLDSFMDQATKDAGRINRLPLLCWKKDRMSWISFLRKQDLPNYTCFNYYLCYKDWVAVSLNELLKQNDKFFFEET